MSRSADLPSRTSSPSQLEDIQQRIQHFASPTCATSARIAGFVARSQVRLQQLPHRYLRHLFIGVSIPAALLAGTVLPSRQPSQVTIRPVAAAYAVQSAMTVSQGDLAMSEEDAAVAFAGTAIDDRAAVEDEGSVSLGHSVPASVRVGWITEDNVNLRREPGTNAAVITKLPVNTKLEMLSQNNGWIKVATAKGTVGWVADDYFTLQATKTTTAKPASNAVTAMIGENRVNLRKGPDTRYGSFGKMAEGTAVTVIARNGNWYQVRSSRGTIGWVAGELIDLPANVASTIPATNNVPPAPRPIKVAPTQEVQPAALAVVAPASGDAASIAMRYVGARYVWGGASPRGFDCSGLTMYVYKQLGLNLPHKASLQYNTPGQRIREVGNLVPGDLVFFVRTTPVKGITHVGIYTGNGMMMTAGTERTGVQHISLYSKYWQSRFVGGVRPYR